MLHPDLPTPAAHDRAIRISLRAAEAQLPGRMEDAINRNLRGAKFGHYCIAASNVRLEVPLEVADLRDGRSEYDYVTQQNAPLYRDVVVDWSVHNPDTGERHDECGLLSSKMAWPCMGNFIWGTRRLFMPWVAMPLTNTPLIAVDNKGCHTAEIRSLCTPVSYTHLTLPTICSV